MKRILIRINAIIIGFGGISDGIGSWLISNWHRLPARPGGHWQCFTFVIDVRRQIPFLKKIAGIEIREIHLWNSPLTSIGLAYSIAFTKMHWRWNCISWTESISLASSSRTFYCQACLTTARFCKSKTFKAYSLLPFCYNFRKYSSLSWKPFQTLWKDRRITSSFNVNFAHVWCISRSSADVIG